MVLLLTACSGSSDNVYYELTIDIKPEDSGTVKPSSGRYKENKELELKADGNLGWKFKEWQNGLESQNNPYSNFTLDNNYTIRAVFEVEYPLIGEVNISNKTANSVIDPVSIKQAQTNFEPVTKSSKPINSISKADEPKYKNKEIIIKYRSNVTSAKIKEFEQKEELDRVKDLLIGDEIFIHYKVAAKEDIQKIKKEYKKISIIEGVQLNHLVQANKIPNDTYYDSQWGVVSLNLEAAWDITNDSSGITIAVVDSGIIPNHPDLKANISNAGYDFVDEDSIPHDLTVITNDGTKFYYCNGHGTHVAGILGAITNNKQGIAGVNWDLNILPIRVLDGQGNGSNSDVAEGIEYAVEQGADIINLSLGGNYVERIQEGEIDIVKSAIESAVNNNVLVFAAAGNGGKDEVMDPASYETTIAVGSLDPDNTRNNSSNYGDKLDIMAPGSNIMSTYGNYDPIIKEFTYDIEELSGTSMATPYVSGVAALLLGQGVKWHEIESILKETAVDLGPTGRDDKFGYGLVDAYGALLWGTEGEKLRAPQVFAATKDGDTLTVQSEVKEVNNTRNYRLRQVDKQKVYIVGWRDVNNSGQVDQGDYYGQVGPIIFDSSQVQKNDLQLNYIGSTTLDVPLNVNGIN